MAVVSWVAHTLLKGTGIAEDHMTGTLRIARFRFAVLAAIAACGCGDDTTSPSRSLVGTWDLVEFTDAGVSATTTGTWLFRSDGTFSVNGTITFPGEPTDPIVVDGTYVKNADTVALTIGSETTNWALTWNGNQVALVQDEPPPANTITLRRQ